MSNELLPCPFCGTPPVIKEWEINGVEQIKIICDGDLCHVHPSVFGNKKTMVEVWNTRAPITNGKPHTKTLIKRAVVDGEELVCVSPWYWDTLNSVIDIEGIKVECHVRKGD